METRKITPVGNSLMAGLPPVTIQALGLRAGDEVIVRNRKHADGRDGLTLTPVRPHMRFCADNLSRLMAQHDTVLRALGHGEVPA